MFWFYTSIFDLYKCIYTYEVLDPVYVQVALPQENNEESAKYNRRCTRSEAPKYILRLYE